MQIRPALSDDLDLLWTFLAMAAFEPNLAAGKGHSDGGRSPRRLKKA
jgi:hypothetical protein